MVVEAIPPSPSEAQACRHYGELIGLALIGAWPFERAARITAALKTPEQH